MLRILLDLVFPPREDESVLRSISTETFCELVSPTLVPTTTPETSTLLHFNHPLVRASIHECKYHKNTQATSLLAEALTTYIAEVVLDQYELEGSSYVLLPMPLSRERLRERGYNQVELVVREAAKTLSLQVARGLVKVRNTKSQTSLTKFERLQNQRGAFLASAIHPNTTYILIDDVLTTGATMQAAIDALITAGVTRIVPIALAH